MGEPVRLFDYWRSTASYRVRIALELAAIDYQIIAVDLVKGEQYTKAHRARNPQGYVPVLEIDGLRLTQSMAILDYLEETGRLSLCPSSPAERAKMRMMSLAIASDLHPVCNLNVVSFAENAAQDESLKPKWMQHFIRRGLIAFEEMLDESGLYCLGGRISQADLVLIPQLYNANRWQVEYADLPKITRVSAACAEISAFKRAAPENVQPLQSLAH